MIYDGFIKNSIESDKEKANKQKQEQNKANRTDKEMNKTKNEPTKVGYPLHPHRKERELFFP